ncbi:MAG: hypothetical protein ACT4UP_00875 [Gammaproteobacteria bacterium]
MTRELDPVVALQAVDVPRLFDAFAIDFYLDADAAREAVRSERRFNMMHLASGIKLDMIVKKSTPYCELEIARGTTGTLGGISTWVMIREDLNPSGPDIGMHDTTPEFSRIVAERHLAMPPEERLRAASDMFETARAIVESSLPAGLTTYERRLALIRRIYGSELPPAAQEAFARHGGKS